MSIAIHRNYEYNNVVLLEVPNTEEYHIGSYPGIKADTGSIR